jgi:HEAT repeat protein
MPREQLRQLADDVARHLVAGSRAAAGASGLRDRARALHALAAKVPALGALAGAVDRAAEPSGLLDLLVMVRQVRAALATAEVDGDLESVERSGPWTTDLRLDEPVFTNLLPELTDPKSRPLNALGLADHEEMGTELRLVGPLLAGLDHPDRSAPERIAGLLPRFGKAVAAELRRDFDPTGERADAMRLRALGRIDPEAARAACREALDHGSEAVREEALGVLQAIDPPEAERSALAILGEPSSSLVAHKRALKSLRVARSDAGLEALLSALDAPDSLWSAAVEALQRCPHPEAEPRLFGLLQVALADKAWQPALRLTPVLIARRHAEALRLFLSWLDSPTKELREWARKQIPYLYEKGEPVVPELIATLGHKDSQVQAAVMDSLLRFGGAAVAATPRLAELLGDKRVGVREKAALTLGAVGSARPDAVATLAAALRDDSAKVRHEAAKALGRFGPAAAAAVPALCEALNDRQAEVCSAAVGALGQVGAAAAGAVPAVLALQQHEYASVRHQAVAALPRLGEPGVAEVVKRLREPGRHAVLGDFRPAAEPTVAALVEALDEEEDEALREASAKALVILTVNAKEAVLPLAGVAVPALARAVRNGPYRARVDSCRALEHLGAAATPAVPALAAAVNDPEFIVRQCARAALRTIPPAE